MDNRHVGHAHGAGQLERGLQPTGRGQIVQHRPGLVDHDQPLAVHDLRPMTPAATRSRRSSAPPAPETRTRPTGRERSPGRRGPIPGRWARRTFPPGRLRPAGAAPTPPDGHRAPGRRRRCAPWRPAPGRGRAGPLPGRAGWAERPAAASARTASSTAVRSGGESGRPSDDAASEQASSARRRQRRRPPGRWRPRLGPRSHPSGRSRRRRAAPPSGRSSGLRRIDPPGASRSGVPPHASARAPYSPLGSTIQAWRPQATCRHTRS